MLKITKSKGNTNPNIIQMCNMKPLQVGRIVEKYDKNYGNLVMRTASRDNFEIMDLSCPGEGECWTTLEHISVELLPPGEAVEISIFNK